MAFATIGTAGIQAQSIDLSSKVTGTLPVPNGGLGIASGTTGQFLKFTGTETLASAADNVGKVLQVMLLVLLKLTTGELQQIVLIVVLVEKF